MCGGTMNIIVSIEDGEVIENILAHINARELQPGASVRSPMS